MRKRLLVDVLGLLLVPLIWLSGCSAAGLGIAYAARSISQDAGPALLSASGVAQAAAAFEDPRASEGPISEPASGAPPGQSVTSAVGALVGHDVGYETGRQGSDPHLNSLDIYAPPAARGLPVLIFVHGGGWSGGDHDPVGAKAAYFTGHGFVLVSVNYRLCPLARPAEQAADVADAVAWVQRHIAAYGGDAGRLFLMGHSAGAHLSALVATDETYLGRVGLSLAALRGVILLDSAAYDVDQLMRSPDGQSELFTAPFGTDPSLWWTVSPRAHVAAGKGTPPVLLLLATPTGQRRPAAEGLAAALRAAGVYAQVADASAFRDHISIDADLGRPGDAPTAAIQAFLDMLLAGAPAGLGGEQVLQPAS